MNPKTATGYGLDSDFLKAFANAGGTGYKTEATLEDASWVEHLTHEHACLDDEASESFPESPWCLVLLVVALIGALVDFLFLVR